MPLRRRFGLLPFVAAPFVVPTAPAEAQPSPPSLLWPDRRFASCGAVDPDRDVLYALGGRADDGRTHRGDVWALELGHGGQAPPSVARSGAGRRAGSGQQLRRSVGPDRRLVLFVGLDGDTTLADVWVADISRPIHRAVRGVGSVGRSRVVRPRRNRLVVFGGLTGAGSTATTCGPSTLATTRRPWCSQRPTHRPMARRRAVPRPASTTRPPARGVRP